MRGVVIPAFLLILLFPFLYLNRLAKTSAESRRIIYRWPDTFGCMHGPIAIHPIYCMDIECRCEVMSSISMDERAVYRQATI